MDFDGDASESGQTTCTEMDYEDHHLEETQPTNVSATGRG